MIPANGAPWEPHHYKGLLRSAIRRPAELLERLNLTSLSVDHSPTFPLRVPEPFLARMRAGDPTDPLLLQVLPQLAEHRAHPEDRSDALEEARAIRAPGLLQKYASRALLITTPACAVHCRYCFRREFPYQEHQVADHGDALAVLRQDEHIEELILSGGDPLALDDAHLVELLTELAGIPHLQRLRIHTRLPIVIPQRVTQTLLDTLGAHPQPVVMVVHVNHPQELDADTASAFEALKSSGVTLLNQAVLLRGVNDDWETQKALALQLFDQGVLPYYLHLPDRVTGTHHFQLSADEAADIMQKLHGRLSGYLVPQLVREDPGQSGKTPIYWTTEAANAL